MIVSLYSNAAVTGKTSTLVFSNYSSASSKVSIFSSYSNIALVPVGAGLSKIVQRMRRLSPTRRTSKHL